MQRSTGMTRRVFVGGGAAMALGVKTDKSPTRKGAGAKPASMKAGHQHHHDEQTLTTLSSLGVNHICSGLPSRTFDESWSVEGLTRLRGQVEKFGIKLEMVPLPLSSS